MKKRILFLALAVSIFSCREKEKVDVQNPAISSFTLNGVSATTYDVEASSDMTVQVSLTDNMGLNQVRINIHGAEDGHTHNAGGSQGGEDRLNVGTWDFSEIINLDGTSASESWTIHVPDSIGGHWHVEISLLDEVGYLSSYIASLHVVNDNLPIATATTTPAADTGGTIHMNANDILDVTGTVTDADGLSQIFIHLDNSVGTEVGHFDIPIFGSGTAISFTPSFDNAQPGNYRLVIEGRDSLGYWGIWDARVVVQ